MVFVIGVNGPLVCVLTISLHLVFELLAWLACFQWLRST